MTRIAAMAALLVFFLLPAGVLAAANICDVKVIPRYPSFNSSMILVIPRSELSYMLSGLSPPMKIRWDVSDRWYTPVLWGAGSMQKFGDCYVCEFSGSTNFDASCGPTPFTEGGEYNIEFFANDFNEEKYFNRTFTSYSYKFTGIAMNIGDDRVVRVTAVAPFDTSEAWITLYDAATGYMVTGMDQYYMNQTEYNGTYKADLSGLEEGTYYAEFGFRTYGGSSGGSLYKLVMEPVSGFSVVTNKNAYFIGETVSISGISSYDKVTGKVILPAGGTVSLGTKTVSDGKYSFDFPIDKSYAKGIYQVRIESSDAVATKDINVSELFTLSKSSLTFTFKDSTTMLYEAVTIYNKANGTLNVTAAVDGLGSYVMQDIPKGTLGSFSSTSLNITASPVGLPSEGKSGRIVVSANGGAVSIPIDVSLILDVSGEECAGKAGPVMTVYPAFWTVEDCLSGETLNQSISIGNAGASSLGGFSASSAAFSVDGDFPGKIDAGGSGSADISITARAGFSSGYIDVSSGTEKARIYVVTSCSEDTTIDIETLREDLEMLSESFRESGFSEDAVAGMTADVESNLEYAQSSIDGGSYAEAYESLAKARAGYDTLLTTYDSIGSSGGGGGGSAVFMVAAVAVIAVIGLLLFLKFGSKMFKKKPADGEGDGGQQNEELF